MDEVMVCDDLLLDRRHVRAGETIETNGKSIKAPEGGLTLVTQGRLREVSIGPHEDPYNTLKFASRSF